MNSSTAALADADPETRFRAASTIYEAGSAAARAATQAWSQDAALAPLFAGKPTVGIAVHAEQFERIRQANGSPALADVPPDQDAREFELHFPGGISIDVLTTRQPHGPGAIARFLDRRGEGIQQIELPVSDVDRASALVREHFSITPVYPETRAGADGTRVNFFLLPVPAGSGSAPGEKVLIELVQAAARRD
ncbi:MAG TPA: hypothetical protein VNJ52_05835 [Patescibacteria group bacterium]|nr:hypothetical protein [Patescibacteria group bacterium]